MYSWYSITPASAAAPARIDLYGDIGEGAITAPDFIAALRALGDVSAIDLHISSGGGDVDAGHTIYNELTRHPAYITAYIDGMAASMATVIAMAADRIVMAANATWMIHHPAMMAVGGKREMDSASKRLDIMTAAMIAAYMRHARADEAQIRTWMDDETWMSAEEAVAAGFAHAVGPASSMAASVDLSKFDRIPGRIAAIIAAPPAITPKAQEPIMADEPAIETPANVVGITGEYVAELEAKIAALEAANADAIVTARAAAVTAERQRIQDVQALAYPGVDAVISECIAGGVNRADAALKLVEFEKARKSAALAKMESSAPPVVATVEPPASAPAVDPMTLDEAGQRAHFAATASLHREHMGADAYIAWCKLQSKRNGAK